MPFHFHDGERTVQRLAGETPFADRNAAIIASGVVGPARDFIARQFMAVLGSTDADGRVWASMAFGPPGFARAVDGTSVRIDMPDSERDPIDPVWKNLHEGADLGMLFIDLGARRRYRVNGTVRRIDDEGIDVAVREAFPNCPKHIQRRELRLTDPATRAGQAAYGTVLRGGVEDIVRQADTLFVASRHPQTGADVSHRGGEMGFARIVDETTLRIPDLPGNSLFNTFGNFQVDAHAGLCIPDFTNGRLLQLTGRASVQWDRDDPLDETDATHRYLDVQIDSWTLRDAMARAEWDHLSA